MSKSSNRGWAVKINSTKDLMVTIRVYLDGDEPLADDASPTVDHLIDANYHQAYAKAEPKRQRVLEELRLHHQAAPTGTHRFTEVRTLRSFLYRQCVMYGKSPDDAKRLVNNWISRSAHPLVME